MFTKLKGGGMKKNSKQFSSAGFNMILIIDNATVFGDYYRVQNQIDSYLWISIKIFYHLNPSKIKQSLNKDCIPTGFIYAGIALTLLSLVLQFRKVSLLFREFTLDIVKLTSCEWQSWMFETSKSHLIMAALFTKPDKKLKEMNPEEYDKARFINSHRASWQFFAKGVKNRLLRHKRSLDLENPPMTPTPIELCIIWWCY